MTEPNDPADPNELAGISPDDEARVRAALNQLADVAMPTDVAERIDDALRNEAAGLRIRAQDAADQAAALAQTSTADPLRRRQQAMAGALAVFVGLVIAAIVVSGHHNAGGSASSSAAAGSGTSITDSGRSWSPEDLQQTVHQTLTGATSSQVPQTGAAELPPSGAPGAIGTTTSGAKVTRPGAESSDAQRVQALISDPAVRQACINALKETADVQPLAVDAGTFNGSPAVAFLFPSSAAANHVDIYVVGPKCSAAESNVLLFDRLPRS